MNNTTDETDAVIREIRDGVRLIVAALSEPLRKRLEQEFLTSAERKKMYREFDGTQSYAVIAQKAGVTQEGVRIFAIALEQAGLISVEKVDGKNCPRKLI